MTTIPTAKLREMLELKKKALAMYRLNIPDGQLDAVIDYDLLIALIEECLRGRGETL